MEDDPSLLVAVSEALEDEGHEIVAVSHGRAALEAILRRRPALVLLDMRLPIMNSWDLARELRAREIALPIVVMTAAQDAAAWAAEIGAAGYLAKPFDLLDLLTTVERLREQDGALRDGVYFMQTAGRMVAEKWRARRDGATIASGA